MNRRELLAALGVASAGAVASAFGCGGRQRRARGAARVASGELSSWLRDAVERLAAHAPTVHAIAVSARRSSAGLDVLGAGVAHGVRAGAVLAMRARDGSWREHATSELTARGIEDAVRALIGTSKQRRAITADAATPPDPLDHVGDGELLARVDAIARLAPPTSRVVYAAALVELDDATVWSIGPGHDRVQRLVRIRERVIRAAWHGARPILGEAQLAWRGTLADHALDAAAVDDANRRALELMTPGPLDDGVRGVVLEPSVGAAAIDAIARALLDPAAARRAGGRRELLPDGAAASPSLSVVDDPTVAGAYGGFVFDDDGEPAQPRALIDAGRIATPVAGRRIRRPGHVGPRAALPSHVVVARGQLAHAALREDGFVLEGATHAAVDAATGRLVVGASRARELRGGHATGRVYADVELVGELGPLLAAIKGVSSEVARFGYRDDRDGEPVWRSVEVPWLRLDGLVRARRSA